MTQKTKKSDQPADAARSLTSDATDSVAGVASDLGVHDVAEPANDILSLAKDYARDKPEVAAVWAFGLGVLVGWKIKPW